MHIAGMMRVKNEERWIEESIRSILPLCDHVFVLDDHSTDRTVSRCLRLSSESVTVFDSPFPDLGTDEARDKNYLLGKVMESGPEWILHIDGDEVLDVSGPFILRTAIESNQATAYALHVYFFWDSIGQIRVDGRFGTFLRVSLFETEYATLGYKCTLWGDGANLHCGNIPASFKEVEPLPVRLKHYGYMLPEDRARKLTYYSQFAQPGDGFPWKISKDEAKFEEWRP